MALPIVDLADREVVAAIDRACRSDGFFYLVGHGIPAAQIAALDARARWFFDEPEDAKLAYRMELAGPAWRGYFPVGGELTSGVPDRKEGLYFGTEGEPGDRRPLHGPNQFPPGMREPVLGYMAACEELGQRVMAVVAEALGHAAFRAHYLARPTTLFRIFHYPASDDGWGVGEHTDYGLLTILAQDACGGLEVRTRDGWLDAPPLDGAFVCNLGDMLENISGGRYRSTPHRVRNRSGRSRISMPFFFDPSFDAAIAPQPGDHETYERWDGRSVHTFAGCYGDYLIDKIARVFPALHRW